jgi:hypothetical protein
MATKGSDEYSVTSDNRSHLARPHERADEYEAYNHEVGIICRCGGRQPEARAAMSRLVRYLSVAMYPQIGTSACPPLPSSGFRRRASSPPSSVLRASNTPPRPSQRSSVSLDRAVAPTGVDVEAMNPSADRSGHSDPSGATALHNGKGMGRRRRPSPGAQRPENPVEHRVELFGEVLGEKAQHEIAVLLQ